MYRHSNRPIASPRILMGMDGGGNKAKPLWLAGAKDREGWMTSAMDNNSVAQKQGERND